MAWFFGLFRRKRKESFPVAVVGESYYQDNLRKICGRPKSNGEDRQIDAAIILDDQNPADALAVRVEIKGRIVGHLSREDARRYRSQKPKRKATCKARIRGGWDRGSDKGSYGVWLNLKLSKK